jgi:hypothetical protein
MQAISITLGTLNPSLVTYEPVLIFAGLTVRWNSGQLYLELPDYGLEVMVGKNHFWFDEVCQIVRSVPPDQAGQTIELEALNLLEPEQIQQCLKFAAATAARNARSETKAKIRESLGL